jgi:hypothetical protein
LPTQAKKLQIPTRFTPEPERKIENPVDHSQRKVKLSSDKDQWNRTHSALLRAQVICFILVFSLLFYFNCFDF